MSDYIADLTARVPEWLEELLVGALAALIAVAAALIVHRIVFRVLNRIARSSHSTTDDMVLRRMSRPTRYALVAVALALAARETPGLQEIWEKIGGFLMPALVGWMALAVLSALVEAMELRTDVTVLDNRNARRRQTRLTIFGRIGSFIIIFIAVGLMLLSIPGVRDVGVTLMASAGLAGLAVGAAAQPALKSPIAGFQMALTEPISIDDVVVIEGEWGRVEDIRTTYVIVRTWDERRLVVPTSKFLESTFENWTKNNSELLAAVLLYLDPMTRIELVRAEFERQVQAHPLWDKRSVTLQVTDATERAIQVRLLMSAQSSGEAWDLRCAIRESMLAWLRDKQPEALVRTRLDPMSPLEIAGDLRPQMAEAART